MKLLLSRHILCTPYNHAPCHFMQSHIRKVYACLAVTGHLHFQQNDRDLLRATAVTRGWNGYRNKSQHRKLTLEKNILPPLLQGFEPATFQSRVRRSNHWAIPLPTYPARVALEEECLTSTHMHSTLSDSRSARCLVVCTMLWWTYSPMPVWPRCAPSRQ